MASVEAYEYIQSGDFIPVLMSATAGKVPWHPYVAREVRMLVCLLKELRAVMSDSLLKLPKVRHSFLHA